MAVTLSNGSRGGGQTPPVKQGSNGGKKRGGKLKYILIAVAALALLGMVFGGKDGGKEPAASADPAAELGVSNVSAAWTKDYDGTPCVVVSYDWTNNGDDTASAGVKLDVGAFQNGVELGMAIFPDSGEDAGSSLRDLKPGATATVTKSWKLSDTSSVVEVEFTRMFRDEPKLSVEFDPSDGSFAAAPSGSQDVPPATDAAVDSDPGASGQDPVEQLPDGAGYVNGHYVEAKNAILSTDYNGTPVIVVTFSWTNNGDKGYSSMSQVMAKAFQDGVELESAAMIMNDEIFDVEPYMAEIKPGVTIDVQRAFELRNTESSVEFEIDKPISVGDNDPVAKTFVLSDLEQVPNTKAKTVGAQSAPTGQDAGNSLLSLEIHTADVLNGSKNSVLGQRAWVDLSSVDTSQVTDAMFKEFVDTVIQGVGYNWFTVVLGDGSGIVAHGCETLIMDYGRLSEDGGIDGTPKYIRFIDGVYTEVR